MIRRCDATAIAVVAILSGCQTLATSLAPAVVDEPLHIRGQVVWNLDDRQAQSRMEDVALASTVSLIDVGNPTFNKTVATTVTDDAGGFDLAAARGFTPGANPYLLEAVKGLFNNAPRNDAARIRTFIQFQAGTWTSTTGPAITISSGTTALALIHGLRLGSANLPGPTTAFIGSLVEPGAQFTPGATLVGAQEFADVRAKVQNAIKADNDPTHLITYQGGVYNLNLTTGPIVNFLDPPAGSVGTTIKIVGVRFEDNPADNVVDFNGVTASVVSGSNAQITVKVPAGALSGNLTVTNRAGASDTKAFQVTPLVTGTFSIPGSP